MGVAELVDRLAIRGVTVRLAGDKIRVRRPDPVPAELEPLLAELKARRDEVVAFLRGREERSTQPHPGDCVCLDCLTQHLFREGAGPGALLRERDTGPGPAPVDLPASLRRDGTCWACDGSRWWVSIYGTLVCATCHPPAHLSLVARWVGPEEAAALRKAAWTEAGTRGKDVSREIPVGGYETRPWIPAREIEWLWDNTRSRKKKLTPVQEYIRGRVAGTIPPPDAGPAPEPYRCDPPAGIPDPMDFRWDSDRQEWVYEPGWWRRLPGKGVAH